MNTRGSLGAPIAAIVSVLVLAGVEALIPNALAWPSGYEETARAEGFDVPPETFSFRGEHWVYPAMLVTIVVVVFALAVMNWYGSRTRGVAGTGDGMSSDRAPRSDSILYVLAIGSLGWAFWVLFTAKRPLVDWIHFPPPVVIVQTLGLELKTGQGPLYQQFAIASAKTVLCLVVALVLVWPAAVWTGLRTGRNPKMAGWVVPYSYALSALPPIILFHLVNDFFSPGVLGKILAHLGMIGPSHIKHYFRDLNWLVNLTLTSWTIFWPIFAASFTAAKSADRRLLAAAEQLGAGARVRFRRIIYPQALEHIYNGVGIGVTMGTIILLYAEARSGVGEQLQKGNWVFYPNLGKSVEDFYVEGHLATVLAAMAYAIGIVLLLKFILHGIAYWRAPWLRKQVAGDGGDNAAKSKDYWEYDPGQHLGSLKQLYDRLNSPTDSNAESAVFMENVVASYGTFQLQLPKLDISKGKFVSIIGESGSGKTSLVELIAGIRMQDAMSGRILIRGRAVFEHGDWQCQPSEGGVGVVHQDFALFSTMTVRENIWFGLEMKLNHLGRSFPKETIAQIRQTAETAQEELLRFLRLSCDRAFLSRYPRQLSGGQRQRVVLARALLAGNCILVVDEGFANIDQPTRGRVREGLFRLASLLQLTVICVSHDNQDVLRNSTQIIYMVNQSEGGRAVGRIARIATPREFFYEPHSVAAAYFIGHRNIYQARLIGEVGPEARLLLTAIDHPNGQVDGRAFEFKPASSRHPGPRFIPATWINPKMQDELTDDFYEAIVMSDHFLGDSHEIVLRTGEGLSIHAVVQDDDYAKMYRDSSEELCGQKIKFRIDGEPLPFASRSE